MIMLWFFKNQWCIIVLEVTFLIVSVSAVKILLVIEQPWSLCTAAKWFYECPLHNLWWLLQRMVYIILKKGDTWYKRYVICFLARKKFWIKKWYATEHATFCNYKNILSNKNKRPVWESLPPYLLAQTVHQRCPARSERPPVCCYPIQ